MTVAIACNLSDGVILGVDSAVTIPIGPNHVKIWENAEKLFQLGPKPIGAAIYGLAGFGDRNIGSYFRQFELLNPHNVLSDPKEMSEVVEELRAFLYSAYNSVVVAAIRAAGQDFDQQLAAGTAPSLGVVVGGFSSNEYVPEIWSILIPYNATPNSSVQSCARGNIGTRWFSMYDPIWRYMRGYDGRIISEIKAYFTTLLGRQFTADEESAIQAVMDKYCYTVFCNSMPIEEGIRHVKFLIDLAINHYHYSCGFAHEPFTNKVVGGRVRIGVVTYKGDQFRILD